MEVDAELATILSSTYFSDSFSFGKATGSPVTRRVRKRIDTILSFSYFSDSFTFDKAAGSPVTRRVRKRIDSTMTFFNFSDEGNDSFLCFVFWPKSRCR